MAVSWVLSYRDWRLSPRLPRHRQVSRVMSFRQLMGRNGMCRYTTAFLYGEEDVSSNLVSPLLSLQTKADDQMVFPNSSYPSSSHSVHHNP